jgi:hypothetical protein
MNTKKPLVSWSPKLGKTLDRGRSRSMKATSKSGIDRKGYQEAFMSMAESEAGKAKDMRGKLDLIYMGDLELILDRSVGHSLNNLGITDEQKRRNVLDLTRKMKERAVQMAAFGRSPAEPDGMLSELRGRLVAELGDAKSFNKFWKPFQKNFESMRTSDEFIRAKARVMKKLFPGEEIKLVSKERGIKGLFGRERTEII